MNKVAELIAKVLRGRSTETVEVKPVCCVPQCEDRPAMMLAATESQAVMASAAHARQWVASRECRYAAGNAAPVIVTAPVIITAILILKKIFFLKYIYIYLL